MIAVDFGTGSPKHVKLFDGDFGEQLPRVRAPRERRVVESLQAIRKMVLRLLGLQPVSKESDKLRVRSAKQRWFQAVERGDAPKHVMEQVLIAVLLEQGIVEDGPALVVKRASAEVFDERAVERPAKESKPG